MSVLGVNDNTAAPSLEAVKGLPGTPVSTPMASMQNELGEQLERLGGLLAILGDKLQPIRNMVPTESKNEDKAEPGYSVVVSQMCRQVDMVKDYQSVVSQIINDLEV